MDNKISNAVMKTIQNAGERLKQSKFTTAFTGAGISVESGIPPFRGPEGIWDSYDPQTLELTYFLSNPEKSWRVVREIFYRYFGKASPNRAHLLLADMEHRGILQGVITQNIDNLHTLAGSKTVVEYHGTSGTLSCIECGSQTPPNPEILEKIPPLCGCGGVYKPDFIFFGEAIPRNAAEEAKKLAEQSEVLIIIGSTGEVYPAAMVPKIAKSRNALIIEINPGPSEFTADITDIFIQTSAVAAAEELYPLLFSNSHS